MQVAAEACCLPCQQPALRDQSCHEPGNVRASAEQLGCMQNWMSSLPLAEAQDLVKDAFVSAGERDIYTGDVVEILTITSSGIQRETLQLKED